MTVQTYYWIVLLGILIVAMFSLVPMERIRRLYVFGLVGGIGSAVGIFMLASVFQLWTIIGGIELFDDFPILPSICWFFPTVIFGCYFPKSDSFIARAGLVLLFAAGSVVAQLVFEELGMWKSIHWNLFYTFLLAITTHTILSLYMMYTEQYLPE